ncbi:MAG: PH domain-containing protein [Clostridia bacterium]|nr:PH domain-containing protein [Clostridia bacterium]
MIKKYKLSKLQRVSSIGLKKYGAIIENNCLSLHIGFFPKKISIDHIKSIEYGLRSGGDASTYFYTLVTREDDHIMFPYSLFDIRELKELLQDLKRIHPGINYSRDVLDLIEREIPEKKKLKFDFEVHKGQIFKMDAKLSQEYPGLDAVFGLSIVFGYILIPLAFGVLGDKYLTYMHGANYPVFKNILFVMSGLALCVTLMNIFIALVSQYLGHKVTFISLTLSVLFLLGGLL